MSTVKSELRKLLSVRSTLFMIVVAFLLTSGLIAFWIYGFKNAESVDIGGGHNPGGLLHSIYASVAVMGVIFSIITVLSVGHEYRYNTIMYSLTNTNRRTKVFFAKFAVLALFALAVGTVLGVLSVVAFYAGLNVGNINAVAQHIPVADVLWRTVAYILGSVTFGFILAVIIRSLIGAIVTVMIVPSTIEGLLSLLLKDNTKFLPYTALNSLVSTEETIGRATSTFSLGIVCAYAAVFGLVAYILFLRRDAN